MVTNQRRILSVFIVSCIFCLSPFNVVEGKASLENQQTEKVSKPGFYSGYSKEIYNECVRISQYVAVRDRTRLAVDIIRPAENGKAVDNPHPVIWTHMRYHRADMKDGKVRSYIDAPPIQRIVKHGYVVGVVDVRGGGASFGIRKTEFSEEEALDAYDITEWFASQEWCDGNIGMFGRSYMGITQYFAASKAPPHLKAIFPEMAPFDVYSIAYPGGIFRDEFIQTWDAGVMTLDKEYPAAPIDNDKEGILLSQAMKEHQVNRGLHPYTKHMPFRNSADPETQSSYLTLSPNSFLKEIKQSGVAIYHLAGWYDLWPRDALLYFKNLNNPQKIMIGPWHHLGYRGFDLTAEYMRWFDYWLKGIDNGIMNEAPVYYCTLGAPEGQKWRKAYQWPLPNAKQTVFYFTKGPSETIASSNDGLLQNSKPLSSEGHDVYAVDYSTTTGQATRWTSGLGGPFKYPDMSENDRKGLTYTSRALEQNIEITGHPVVHLWVTSDSNDGDFFVYLEEIDGSGYSHYITEGNLRASHRALGKAPYDNLNLPYHRSFREDISELPDNPVKLAFDLHPTSNLFDKGHRIRITITCADKDNTSTPTISPAPKVNVWRNKKYPSHIVLPIIQDRHVRSNTLTN